MGNMQYRVDVEKGKIEFKTKDGKEATCPIFDEHQKNDMLGKMEAAGYMPA